jgi:hypothetical protein
MLPADVKNYATAQVLKIDANLREIFTRCMNADRMCQCCFGAMVGDSLKQHTELILESISKENLTTRSIYLNVLLPPMVDVARLTTRTIITMNVEKTFAFPTLKELLTRLLSERLSKIHGLNMVDDESSAEVQVSNYHL